jgi:hypothetical protein
LKSLFDNCCVIVLLFIHKSIVGLFTCLLLSNLFVKLFLL